MVIFLTNTVEILRSAQCLLLYFASIEKKKRMGYRSKCNMQNYEILGRKCGQDLHSFGLEEKLDTKLKALSIKN